MVEFDIQLISVVIAAASVVFAALSYVQTSRQAQKTREDELATRRTQVYLEYMDHMWTVDWYKMYLEFLSMEWKDYEDFETKYGSDNNPDSFAKRNHVLKVVETTARLVRSGVLSIEEAFNTWEYSVTTIWRKYESIIREQRTRYKNPPLGQNLEWLHSEFMRIAQNRGLDIEPPKTFTKYVKE